MKTAASFATHPLTLGQIAAVIAVLLVGVGLTASVAIVHQRGQEAVRQVQATCDMYEAHVIELEDRVDTLTFRLLTTGELSHGQIPDRDALIDELEGELIHSATPLAHLQPAADASGRVVTALRDARLNFPSAPPAAGEGNEWWIEEASLVLDVDRGAWYFFTTGLPELEPDRIYQLWLMQPDGARTSAGTFRVGPQGRGFLTGEIPGDISDFSLAAITDEPAGGSEAPTGSIRVAGEL